MMQCCWDIEDRLPSATIKIAARAMNNWARGRFVIKMGPESVTDAWLMPRLVKDAEKTLTGVAR